MTTDPAAGTHPHLQQRATRISDPVPGPLDHPARGRVRRSARDWAVDAALFLASLAVGVVMVGYALERPVPPSDGLVFLDLVAGFLGCLALWWRRRWPVGVALLLAALGSFSDMAGLAVVITLFTVAVHRPTRTLLVVAAANVAGLAVSLAVRPVGPDESALGVALGGTVLIALVVAWGMVLRARRQLVLSLRDRVDRAEVEQRFRVEQARDLERTRIAREMHDVLAHRLTLLSMHAGALEFRPDAPASEVARAAGVIRASARGALEDLREVIGVLRDTTDGRADDGAASDRPQPTLGDLRALVEESRQAGLQVHEEYRLPDPGAAPAVLGRTAYRVVQEGLTNVRKHAPGAAATVLVEGTPGRSLAVEVRNPPAVHRLHAPLPSAGTGLVGLLERVSLAHGTLAHGWTADGGFRLRAELPWPVSTGPDGAPA